MSVKDRSRQRVKSLINKLERGTESLTDEEFARLKRMIVERRGHDATHVTVAPIDTARPCSPRSRSSETSFDARLYGEKRRGQDGPGAKSAQITIGRYEFGTPGQQCLPKWETGRTTADGYLLANTSSNLGETLFPPQNALSGREPVA